MPEPDQWSYTEDGGGGSRASASYSGPKVIVAIQFEDGTITTLAGIAQDVTLDMERDEIDGYWSGPYARSVFGPTQYEAHIRFLGAVQYQHMAGFDDIPDPQVPPAELENRREIEGGRKELEG